ncbi:TULIP family P47-like protein [Bacteroides graminisolvens]|uniref:TULIP family P47-like protein n=1 Tax=Bacteroides graminisolvens TaxID=477666 RepID=UPI0029C74850|nr:TULIP family P47-like protein [Bacteroides graminisolvens]
MNTKGWDTVGLVKTEHVNQDIRNCWHLFNNEIKKTEVEYELSGKFGPWQITDGGSNKLIRFNIPFESGTFRLFDNASIMAADENSQKEYSLTNCECIVEMMMDFVNTDNNKKLLKLDIKQLAKSRDEIASSNEQGGWIVPILFKGNIPAFYQPVILELVCQYLIEHPEQINYVFASINFAQESGSWVTPVKCKYSYLDSQPSYMGVLSVCSNKDITNMPVDIDVNSLPGNPNSYFITSSDLFLLNVMMPSFIDFFQHSNSSDYRINDLGILVNTRSLEMNSVKSGAIWYTPIIEGLEVSVLGGVLEIKINGKCDLKAGIWMYFNGRFKAYPQLSNQVVEFRIDGTPSFDHHEDIPWYLAWLLPLVGLITKIVVSCISSDLMNSITKIFGERMHIDNISPVAWTGNPKEVNLVNVKLDDSFIIEYIIN